MEYVRYEFGESFDAEQLSDFERRILEGGLAMDIDPFNSLIRWLLVLLLLVVLGWVKGVRSPVQPDLATPAETPNPTTMTQRYYTHIDSVEAIMLMTYRVRIHLKVKGYQPNLCVQAVDVVQRREGNKVFVKIYRDIPAAYGCFQAILPYEATIPLEGGFESGDYTIDVNGFVINVKV